jgi:hypothetical protein
MTKQAIESVAAVTTQAVAAGPMMNRTGASSLNGLGLYLPRAGGSAHSAVGTQTPTWARFSPVPCPGGFTHHINKEKQVKKIIIALGSMFMLLFVLVACSAALATDTTTSTDEPAAVSTEKAEPKVEETEEPEVVEPELTLGQENAVEKAESYLSFTSFSRSGLIDQLEYEDFTKADATFAVDYLDVDWNEQAAGKAESYMDLGGFSRSSLIDQLEFEGFTAKQAAFGAKAVGY